MLATMAFLVEFASREYLIFDVDYYYSLDIIDARRKRSSGIIIIITKIVGPLAVRLCK